MKRADVKSLLGRTIERVVVHENIASGSPRTQVFLHFSDGAYAEFYSNGGIAVSSPKMGDAEEYTRGFPGGEIEVFDKPK